MILAWKMFLLIFVSSCYSPLSCPPLGLSDFMTQSYDLGRNRGRDPQHCVWKKIWRKHRKLLLLLRESLLSRCLISMVTGSSGEICPKVANAWSFFLQIHQPTGFTSATRTQSLHKKVFCFSHAEACKENNMTYKGVRECIMVSSCFPQNTKKPTSSLLKCSTATNISCHNNFLAMQNLTRAACELVYYCMEDSTQVSWIRKPREIFNS